MTETSHNSLYGSWRGEQMGGVDVSVTFYSDGAVLFCDSPGIWDIEYNSRYPTLKMTFTKQGADAPFSTLNPFTLTDSGELLLDTERGSLLLRRISNPSNVRYSPTKQQSSPHVQDTTQIPFPQSTISYDSPTNESILKSNAHISREYHNNWWGVHLMMPTTWFYSVNNYIPTVLSCFEPGIMYIRFHRPYTEAIRREKYISGYSEGHLFFEATFSDMIDVPDSLSIPQNRVKIAFGDYKEKKAQLLARAVTVSSAFGDCILVMGVCSDDQRKFLTMTNAMTQIAESIYFSPPLSPLAYQCIPGKYVNERGEILELYLKDMRFSWSNQIDFHEKYGVGTWERAGNDLEGDLIFIYDDQSSRRIKYTAVDEQRTLRIEDTNYRRIS
jgi:hypothetical protein